MGIFFGMVFGIGTLLYLIAPFRGFSSSKMRRLKATSEGWNTLPQLELDRELGKIDEAEFQELKQRTRPDVLVTSPIESLIAGVRAARKLDRSLETEVLVARQRSLGKAARPQQGKARD